MKVKFEKYNIDLKGHGYEVLIPRDTEQLWITGYDGQHWGLNWEGNRKGLEALLYSSAVLGLHPKDKLIYFPIRKNEKHICFRRWNVFPGERDTYIDVLDMVFTTNQTPFKRSDWKNVKNMMKFCKCEVYTLNFESGRTINYFNESCKRWESSSCIRKEYSIQTVQEDTLFQIFSKMQYRELFLGLHDFLQRDLEEEFMDTYDGGDMPCDALMINDHEFPYRHRLQMPFHPWVIFCDTDLEEQVRQQKGIDI